MLTKGKGQVFSILHYYYCSYSTAISSHLGLLHPMVLSGTSTQKTGQMEPGHYLMGESHTALREVRAEMSEVTRVTLSSPGRLQRKEKEKGISVVLVYSNCSGGPK